MFRKSKLFFTSLLLLLVLCNYYAVSSFLYVAYVDALTRVVMQSVTFESYFALAYIRRVELVVSGDVVVSATISIFNNDNRRDIAVYACVYLYDDKGGEVGAGCTTATVPRRSLQLVSVPIPQAPLLESVASVEVYVS
ncbi:MAG: hypothetical protein QW584_02835 [Thermofilaceae archaeon]